jgi:peroxiredoxin
MGNSVKPRHWLLAAGVAAVIASWPLIFAPARSGVEVKAADQAKLDFVLKDMTGKDVRLADYRGRPLVINFWATYCGPCKTEIPALVELVEKYKSKNFTVLGVSIDDSPEDLQQFAKEYRMNYPVLVGLGHDDLLEAYEANMFIPISWFVKSDGTLYLKKQGSDTKEWFEEQIRALF